MAVSHRGAISFGMVHIPVGLYTATQDNDIHFNQLCKEDGSRVKYKKVQPLSLLWEDGTVYEIDRVLDVRRAASLKAGGMGIRYTVRINGKQSYLFYEEPRWFVEAKV